MSTIPAVLLIAQLLGKVFSFESPQLNFPPATLNCSDEATIVTRLRQNYDKNKVPGEGGVSVEVEVSVQEVTKISDITSDFQADLYISELWLDPSLNFEYLSPCKQNLSLGNDLLKTIWMPNTCFVNSKTATIHESPYRNIFFMIYPNGTVWINYRVKITGPCSMDFTMFPFDTLDCMMIYESFNYNTDEVRMKWSAVGAAPMREKMSIVDYELTGIQTYKNEVSYPAGNWHDLTMVFNFRRRYGFYFLQAYLPTYITMCISWISFYLGSDNLPARTLLGVSSLLSMTFQFGNVIQGLPRVNYVKAIDIWMLASITFIFCSLLELASVGLLTRVGLAKRPWAHLLVPSWLFHLVEHHHNHSHVRISPKKQHQNEPKPNSEATKYNSVAMVPNKVVLYDTDALRIRSLPKFECPCQCHFAKPIEIETDKEIRQKPPDIPPPTPIELGQEIAAQLDFISSIVFPSLFAIFNLFYWIYYLGDFGE